MPFSKLEKVNEIYGRVGFTRWNDTFAFGNSHEVSRCHMVGIFHGLGKQTKNSLRRMKYRLVLSDLGEDVNLCSKDTPL